MNEKFQPGTPAFGVICAGIGIIIALILLFLGIWRLLVIALFAVIGYFIGAVSNKPVFIKELVNRLFPNKQ